jgi:hypothetical protein
MVGARSCFTVVVAWFLLACPCPAAEEESASVKGTITLDGKPLAGGRIVFHLDNDQFVGAKIKCGKYRLDRVPTGKHKVTIEFKDVPARYSSEDQSKLTVVIAKGEMTLDFSLLPK